MSRLYNSSITCITKSLYSVVVESQLSLCLRIEYCLGGAMELLLIVRDSKELGFARNKGSSQEIRGEGNGATMNAGRG